MEGIQQSQFDAGTEVPAGKLLTHRWALSVALALAAGVVLRVWMLHALFAVDGDSLVYGGIAKNLLLHGRYALTTATGITYPTLIRLPGYPLFLALCFRLFGMENYWAVGCVQIGVEVAGCVLLADFAYRIARALRPASSDFARQVALATLWLAALCPFTASYTPSAMAETLTLFTLALAMDAMARFCDRPGWGSALAFTCAVTFATLLRPDGALVALAFAPALLIGTRTAGRRLVRMAVVCLLVALAPFAVWTWRNWQVFHVFEPLAPRLATDPGEQTNPGWERWVKSWCLDFTGTYNIYWNVPDDTLDVNALPARAFDSPAEYAETAALAADYNAHDKRLTPEIDARFGRLADQRIAAHPLRYYIWLPLGRLADMIFGPRTENLPVDLDWWDFGRHPGQTTFAWFYVALNLAYLLLGAAGLWLRPRFWQPLLAYLLLRCALLLTVEAPEARYTLEFFPIVFALGGVALAAAFQRTKLSHAQPIASVSSVTGMPTRE